MWQGYFFIHIYIIIYILYDIYIYILHYIILYYIDYIVLYNILYYIILYDIILYYMISYHIILYHIISFHIISYIYYIIFMAKINRATQLRKHVFSTCIKDWMCFVGFQCNLSPFFFPLWQNSFREILRTSFWQLCII
jgi:hypothetical protein